MAKTKLFAVVLSALVLIACCVSAGCTGADQSASVDPIVGTYQGNTYSDGSKDIYVFCSNGTFNLIAINSDSTKMIKVPYIWNKTGDNVYSAVFVSDTIAEPVDMKFSVSADKSSLIIESSGKTVVFPRISNFKIPTGIEVITPFGA